MNVYVVHGPPLSGKSTYVQEHKGPNDLVFDFDLMREVEFEGERYKVIRTYRGGMTRHGSKLAFDEMELTCEKVTGF